MSNDDNPTALRSQGRSGRSKIEALLDEVREGSTEALGALFEGCRKYLLLVANRALDSDLRPKTAASDLVQDSFVEVHRDFANFHGDSEEELFAWLAAILAHRISNNERRYRHVSKRSVNREMPLEVIPNPELIKASNGTPPHDEVIAREEERRLQLAIGRLPPGYREVLVLRTWERRTFVEIGAALNKSPDAARKLWSRAVRLLEELLQEIA